MIGPEWTCSHGVKQGGQWENRCPECISPTPAPQDKCPRCNQPHNPMMTCSDGGHPMANKELEKPYTGRLSSTDSVETYPTGRAPQSQTMQRLQQIRTRVQELAKDHPNYIRTDEVYKLLDFEMEIAPDDSIKKPNYDPNPPDDGKCRECYEWRQDPSRPHLGYSWWGKCEWKYCTHKHHEGEILLGAPAPLPEGGELEQVREQLFTILENQPPLILDYEGHEPDTNEYVADGGWDGAMLYATADRIIALFQPILQATQREADRRVVEARIDGYSEGVTAALKHANKMKFALIINRSSSKCGRCGGNADPHSDRHILSAEWVDAGKGCGVAWRYVTSEYAGMEVEKDRPDLTPIDHYPPFSPLLQAQLTRKDEG